MSTMTTPVGAATAAPPKGTTIRSAKLERALRVHGLLVLVVPAIGTAVAVATLPVLGFRTSDVAGLVLMYLVSMVGITVGFHRYFAHRSFRANGAVESLFVVAGSMALQGPVVYWVATHRRHHRFADGPGDPHSPSPAVNESVPLLRRLWHAHVGWTMSHDLTNTVTFARDLLRNGRVVRLGQRYYWWAVAGYAVPTVLGFAWSGDLRGAVGGLLWGGFVRTFLVYHATMSVNSVAHAFGRRPFDTPDDSRNNAWLALPTCGESWHNSHHASPASAIFGRRWWQVDVGGATVLLLRRLGVVDNVRRPRSRFVEDEEVRARG